MRESPLYRVFLLPASVFLSVVFGASYGTGREVMEFVGRHGGAGGMASLVTILLTYGVLLSLAFELARRTRSWDYDAFFKVLLGRAGFLYELVILVGMALVLAIVAAAAGTLVQNRFGVPAAAGSAGALLIVVGLTFRGRALVQDAMVASVTALAVVIVWMLATVVPEHGDEIAGAFAAGRKGPLSEPVVGGMTYALVNGGFIPMLLYCARELRAPGEAVRAGFFAGVCAALPALAFHLVFLAGGPEVVEQALPAYWVLDRFASPALVNAYLVVLFVLVVQTGVGILQGFVDRVSAALERRRGSGLSNAPRAGLAAAMVLLAMGLSEIGIIELIARGYDGLSVAFVVVFALPLLTRGLYLVLQSGAGDPGAAPRS